MLGYHEQRRVVGVGHKLVLGNITRDSDDVFECHADNGVPPTARKTFHVTVECKHFLIIINAFCASFGYLSCWCPFLSWSNLSLDFRVIVGLPHKGDGIARVEISFQRDTLNSINVIQIAGQLVKSFFRYTTYVVSMVAASLVTPVAMSRFRSKM